LETPEEASGHSRGPPQATLARRAKSYSDFYDAAFGYLVKETEKRKQSSFVHDLENAESEALYSPQYEDCENDLLYACRGEYQ
jgi:hypothetical protein